MFNDMFLKYSRHRYHLLPYLYLLTVAIFLWSTLDNFQPYKNKYGFFLILFLLVLSSLVIEGFLNQSKYKKGYCWWQFKIDPSTYRIFDYFRDHPSSDFYTWTQAQSGRATIHFAYFEKEIMSYVKEGDRVVLWVHGEPIGIYALGEIIEKQRIEKMNLDEKRYYLNLDKIDKKITQIKIKYLYKLFDNPIPHDFLHKKGLSKYRDEWLGGILNPSLPEKFVKYPRPLPPKLNILYDFQDYKIGKLDTYGWIPIKPIWEDVWKKNLFIIEKDKWN